MSSRLTNPGLLGEPPTQWIPVARGALPATPDADGPLADGETSFPDGAGIATAAEASSLPTEGRPGMGANEDVPPVGGIERYQDCGELGRGGMAEVRRVYDRILGRSVALKILRADRAADLGLRARFLREARVTGRLQHPSIPAVHDLGMLPDGRPWFTLKEIRGETLATAILALEHAGGASEPAGRAALRRLIEALRLVGSAIAYAHDRGVVHRDLKPSNVMLGTHGEVLVMDWGIAQSGGEVDLEHVAWDEVPGAPAEVTQVGLVLGTRGYMPPEQLLGAAGPPADVFALGQVLQRVLNAAVGPSGAGRPGRWDGDMAPLARLAGATLLEPEARPTANELVARLGAWLDGTARREDALALVREATELGPAIGRLRHDAADRERHAASLLAALPKTAAVAERLAAWRQEDAARALRREADLLAVRREQLLHAALVRAEDLEEAHTACADLLRAEHAAAEARHDEDAALCVEIRLRAHVEALPPASAARAAHAAWLQGDGALTLLTEPPRARVRIFRIEERERRLVEVPGAPVGPTPLRHLALARGSYVLHLDADGCEPVRYPVSIGRNEHWDGAPPEGGPPRAIVLPRRGALGPHERYVPAGWFGFGGDAVALDAFDARRMWVDGFVAERDPVTNRAYIAFLDALVADGREAEALRHVPRDRASRADEEANPIYGRRADGGFTLVPDADGDTWDPDWPVVLVDQRAAWAFARWRAARDGLPWRLPTEHEWEKAARGVDGRIWPWGNHYDPTWACTRDSHTGPGPAGPARVDAYPGDVSPYGLRGLGGNVRDWCANVGTAGNALPAAPSGGGRAPPPPDGPLPPGTWASARGGYWMGVDRTSRVCARYRQLVELKNESIGIRLVRSI